MKAPNGLLCLAISVFFCSFIGGVRNQQSCPPPDVPTEGRYTPQQKKFLPGDKVAYGCKDGFTLMGKGDRTCKSNGAWSDSTPFCDRPVKLKNPRRMNNGARTLSYVIDEKTNTCFPWENSTGDMIQVYLDEPAVVHAVRIFLDPGSIKIQIFSNRENKVYALFDRYIERSQWVLIKCENSNTLTDYIKIKNTADKGGFTICEIEVYVKDEFGCEYPPDLRIPHGFFEVSRNKATLQCEEGFTAAHKRLVCEGNEWKSQEPACNENLCEPLVYNSTLDPGTDWIFLDSVKKLSPGTRRQLKCESGYQKVGGPERVICQKNGLWSKTNATCKAEPPKTSTRSIIMIAVGTVVVLIVLLLLAVTIYLIKKQRSREVVVVFKPTGDCSLPPGSESEYATVYYDTVQGGVPIPPTTQRPSPLPPVLNDGYILPEDCKRTLKKQNPMPADIAFGTLKPSVLYSN